MNPEAIVLKPVDAIRRGEPDAGQSGDRFTWMEVVAVLAILGGAFMVVLDFFVVIVALPSIQRELGSTPAMLGLVVAGYAASTAAGLVAGGRLGDIFGRRKILLIGLALFTAASIGCGLAESTAVLVAMRVLQGLSGALVQPQVLALLGVSFTGAKRSRAFAWYAMAMGVAGVAAQLIGALVIEADLGGMGWRGCFLINLPIGLAALALTALTIRETDKARDVSLDWLGMSLVGATLSMLVLALTYGRDSGWPAWSFGLIAAAVACVFVFAWHENRLGAAGGMPMIPGRLLTAPGFAIGVLAVFVFYAGVASFYFVLGLHLQQARGMHPMVSGLLFAVLGGSFFACSMLGKRIDGWLGDTAMFAGAGVMALGHAWQLAVDIGGGGLAWIIPGLLAQGAGIGMVMAPLVAKVVAAAPGRDAGVASGVLATVQQVGNALGVAAISAVFAMAPPVASRPASLSGFSLGMLYLIAVCAALGWVLRRVRDARPRHG